jgi:ankyrin repeat protein
VVADFALHDAQRVIAREYGFSSWARLKLHLETRTTDAAETRLFEAVLNNESDVVGVLLLERPALKGRSSYIAAALGDETAVTNELTRDTAFARTKGGPRNWDPLLYLCFGQVGGSDLERAAIARKLLAAGADPNGSWINSAWPESPLPALYGATGVNNFPHLARVLLEAGADPNDGESRYHAAEHNHVECLNVLAEFGTDFSGADRTWGNTPLYFLFGYTHASDVVKSGIRWLLEHGANPNVVSHFAGVAETALHAAVKHDWDVDTIEELIRHGADVNATRADGRTPYALAVSTGRSAIAELLRANDAHSEVSTVDELLGACMRADATAAEELVRRNPGLVSGLLAEERKVVLAAAQEGRASAIALMAELGFDLEVVGENGEHPLHWAAWHGWVEATEVLIERGVELNVCDSRFGAPPTGWCAHGSQFCANADGNYGEVMARLIAAGARVPNGTNGTSEIMAVLKQHGLDKPSGPHSGGCT